MTVVTMLLLAVSAAVSLVPARGRIPYWLIPTAALALLGLAAAFGAAAEPAHGVSAAIAYVVTVLAAAIGGSTVVTAVFRTVRRRSGTGPDPDDDAGPLHGGLAIGILERIAVAGSVLAGWPEGIAIVLAVKGLARYPELRAADPTDRAATPRVSSASEQFIIGTLTSVMWAIAVCGVGLALLT